MRRKLAAATALVGLTAILPLGNRAIAQEGSRVNNVQCFIVATVYARMGKEEEKLVAQRAEAFYLGRISGSPAQLQAEFSAQLRTITDQNNAALMNACARAMSQRADEILAVQQAFAKSQTR